MHAKKALGRGGGDSSNSSTHLTSELNGGGRSPSGSGRFIPAETAPGDPMKRGLGRAKCWSFLSEIECDSPIAKPVLPVVIPALSSKHSGYHTAPLAVTAPEAVQSAHTVYLCVLRDSDNRYRYLPCTGLIFITDSRNVLCNTGTEFVHTFQNNFDEVLQ